MGITIDKLIIGQSVRTPIEFTLEFYILEVFKTQLSSCIFNVYFNELTIRSVLLSSFTFSSLSLMPSLKKCTVTNKLLISSLIAL